MAEARFTMRQLIAIAGSLSAISGAGGAITVKAQDAVQDERLEQHERQIEELRVQVLAGTQAATETRTTVKGLEHAVDDIRTDTKEIQRLLNRLIGGRNRDALADDEL
mgnify:CR=1 FL=1